MPSLLSIAMGEIDCHDNKCDGNHAMCLGRHPGTSEAQTNLARLWHDLLLKSAQHIAIGEE